MDQMGCAGRRAKSHPVLLRAIRSAPRWAFITGQLEIEHKEALRTHCTGGYPDALGSGSLGKVARGLQARQRQTVPDLSAICPRLPCPQACPRARGKNAIRHLPPSGRPVLELGARHWHPALGAYQAAHRGGFRIGPLGTPHRRFRFRPQPVLG